MCNCNCTNTVNIPVHTYENMKQEIEILKKEVEKKTIEVHVLDPHWFEKWISLCLLSPFIWGFIYLMYFT